MNDGRENKRAGDAPAWVDRYLPKILVAAAAICALALVGRALTG